MIHTCRRWLALGGICGVAWAMFSATVYVEPGQFRIAWFAISFSAASGACVVAAAWLARIGRDPAAWIALNGLIAGCFAASGVDFPSPAAACRFCLPLAIFALPARPAPKALCAGVVWIPVAMVLSLWVHRDPLEVVNVGMMTLAVGLWISQRWRLPTRVVALGAPVATVGVDSYLPPGAAGSSMILGVFVVSIVGATIFSLHETLQETRHEC